MPSAMPIRPPISDSVTASTRNCPRMSRVRAPTAMRRPISRVRSVTDTSMMFMMPMPPTSSETEATAASSSASTRLEASCAAITSCRLRSEKSSSPPGLQAVALAQQRAHLLLGHLGVDAVGGLDPDGAHGAVARRARGPSTRLRAVVIGIRIRSSWSVPIMLWPLVSSTPMMVNGTRLMRIDWSSGSAAPNSCCATVCADQGHLGGAGHLGGLEAAAGGERPLAHVEVLGRDAEDLRRPVGVAPDHLRAAAQRRRGERLGDLAVDGDARRPR